MGVFERVRREWGTSLVVTGATVLALGGGVVIRGLGGLGIDVVVASVAAATVLGRVGVAAPAVLRGGGGSCPSSAPAPVWSGR